MTAHDPLSARTSLTRADLCGEPLLTSRAPTRDMAWFNKPLAAPRVAPLTYHVLPLTEAVIDFARAGMGIGVLSEWVAEPHLRRGDLVARRLASGPLRRPWRLVWRKEVDEAARRLWRVLEKAAPRVTRLPPARAPRERLRA